MPAKDEKNNIPCDILELYIKLVATMPEIEPKGATVPYTSYNSHMFSNLEKRWFSRAPAACSMY
jgi:hypothetical protein